MRKKIVATVTVVACLALIVVTSAEEAPLNVIPSHYRPIVAGACDREPPVYLCALFRDPDKWNAALWRNTATQYTVLYDKEMRVLVIEEISPGSPEKRTVIWHRR